MVAVLQIPFTISDLYTYQGLSSHIQADLIWCDGTFKELKTLAIHIAAVASICWKYKNHRLNMELDLQS
jgi:hypothetical protein